MIKKKKTLKNTFIFAILSTIIIVNSILILFFGFYNYYNEKKRIKKEIKLLIQNITPAIENYLWEIDIKNLKRFAKGIIKTNEEICNLIIYNENSNILVLDYKKNKICSKSNLNFITKNFYRNNYFLGSLKVSYSIYFIKKELKKYLLLISLSVFSLSIILLFIISKIFTNVVEDPITYLIENFAKISKGDHNLEIPQTEIKEFNYVFNELRKMAQKITEKEEEIKSVNRELDLILNSLPICVFIIDKNGKYVEINDGCCNLLKMTKHEILSKNIGDLSGKDYSTSKGFKVLERAFKEDKFTFEWKIKDKFGKEIDVLGTTAKINIQNKECILFTITDISYIKKLEKELIEREKLQTIGIIAGGIAHDFNNMLASIEGNIELANIYLKKGDIEKAKEKLSLLQKILNRAKFLTNQLLTFSKGGTPAKVKIIDCKKLIKDIANFVLSGTEITVDYHFDDNLYPVKGDPEQLGLVFQNLLINAKQALDNKGKIEIRGKNVDGKIEISIKDYGPGIPPEILDKIWEPFFTTKEDGTGLGLSIIKNIITQFNGEISVHSEPNKFTEFIIILPAFKEDQIENVKKISQLKPEFKKKLKILVLEDDKDVQQTIKEMIILLGHDVVITSTGEEAIEKYKREKFDLVLMDLTIRGGLDGKECIKILKEFDPHIKAIVYSGYYEDPAIKNFEKFGFKFALKKPFKLEDLKEAIEKCYKE